jgi:hypothetical protein
MRNKAPMTVEQALREKYKEARNREQKRNAEVPLKTAELRPVKWR